MRCCEAWKPFEDCFDTSSFECVDLQRLSQIISNLTRETLAEREAQNTNLSWIEKDNALARCRNGQRAWRDKKLVPSLSAVTDEEGHPLENDDDYVSIRERFSRHVWKARGIISTTIFCDVQQAPDDIRWTIDQTEFDELKKDSDPGPDGIPYGAYRCTGGLGSRFLFNAYRALLKGGADPDCFDEIRTFFSPRPLTSMTMEGLFDHLMRFVH